MAITRKGDSRFLDRAPGVAVHILTDGDQITLVRVELETDSVVAMHTHVHEQTGTLISGRLVFEIGGEKHELKAGDAWMIPSNVPHEVTTVEKALVIEAFSPPREDWR
jgi:quercetin dioxygenase-like cupin family protein